MPPKIIDAHFHLWSLAREDYWWFRDMPELNRDFMEPEYEPLRSAAGIDRTIIVQALESEAETEFMLALAAKHDWISGVIGWVDFEAKMASVALAKLAQHRKFVGVRNWAVGRPDVNWLSSDALTAGFSTLAETGLTYDALVSPQNLPALIKRFEMHPTLKLCINHFAYPLPEWEVDGEDERNWKRHLQNLADMGAVIKFSGFGHKTDGAWRPEVYDRFVAHVLDCFGPAQIIWASNWPTVVKECTFENWLAACQNWTQHLPEKDRHLIFEGNAQRFYALAAK